MKAAGDLVDAQAVDQLAGEARSACRVKGWSGLEGRRLPLTAAVFPKALLEWSSACASGQVRAAVSAPAIYCLGMEEGQQTHRLHAASRKPDTSNEDRDLPARRAQYRLIPATHCPRQHNDERPTAELPLQAALTPRQVTVLGHLLAHVKYPLAGSYVMPCTRQGGSAGFQLSFNSGAMICRLGYARGGDAYRALEDDLTALAQFVVRHESRQPQGEWKTGQSSTLLTHLNTGRRTVTRGHREDVEGVRRDERWTVAFGGAVQTLAQAQPSCLTVMSAGVWAAAGRSRIDQWLALWVSGHGYDGRDIHSHRVETLGRRMRLLPDNLASALDSAAGANKEVAPADPAIGRFEGDWSAPVARVNRAETETLSSREALSQARGYWRQIKKSVARLQARNAIQSGEWVHQKNAPDIRASHQGRAVSRTDHIHLRRWTGPVEGVLPAARRWIARQWSDLLSGLNGAFTTLNEAIGAADESSSWATDTRQSYQERLEWLREDGRRAASGQLHNLNRRLRGEIGRMSLLSQGSRSRLRFSPLTPSSSALLAG